MNENSPGAWITIGELAKRTGAATSALRFYESVGLIASTRTEGNQRRFARAMIRIVSVVRAAQALGLPLETVRRALNELPEARAPTPQDWSAMSAGWRDELDERIDLLQKLRDSLDSCIGCGCLSLETCQLFNEQDKAGSRGPGPRYLQGDRSEDIPELN